MTLPNYTMNDQIQQLEIQYLKTRIAQLEVERDYLKENVGMLVEETFSLESMLDAIGAGGVEPLRKTDTAAQALKQGEQVAPYTGDVARIMREAGMTFHLGLPHKAVVEQMTRVVDLVYAEASIKAAVAFAAPQPDRQPLTDEQIIEIADKTQTAEPGTDGYILPISFTRAIEQAHSITGGQ